MSKRPPSEKGEESGDDPVADPEAAASATSRASEAEAASDLHWDEVGTYGPDKLRLNDYTAAANARRADKHDAKRLKMEKQAAKQPVRPVQPEEPEGSQIVHEGVAEAQPVHAMDQPEGSQLDDA